MATKDIILFANSPGELAALVKPACEAIQKEISQARVILVLTPCQYASGKEEDYAKNILKIENVISAPNAWNWIIKNKKPDLKFGPHGAVIFLGGDLFYPTIIARRLDYPAIAYIQEHISWTNRYSLFMVPDEKTFQRFAKGKIKDKIRWIGNLMVDSVGISEEEIKAKREKAILQYKLDPDKKIIAFMPGSKKFELEFMVPFFKEAAEKILSQRPDLQMVFSISAFCELPSHLKNILANFPIIPQAQEISDFVITIPGTNTAQLAVLGQPMLVVFPINQADQIPLEGPAHLITSIPILGKVIKHLIARLVVNKKRFFALPNIKAGREIVPEIKGCLNPGQVVKSLMKIIDNKEALLSMKKDLKKSMGPAGAAQKLAIIVKEILEEK